MLILSRSTNEAIRINGEIVLTVLEIQENRIKFGITFLNNISAKNFITCSKSELITDDKSE